MAFFPPFTLALIFKRFVGWRPIVDNKVPSKVFGLPAIRASYFLSIEKKYGKPIEHWMKELKKVSKLAHMEQVAHLKEKFEMGHGHANALVVYFRKKEGL